MVKGKLVDLDVCGTIIKDVVITEKGVLYTKYGDRGRHTERPTYEQVKTKTLRQLAKLDFILTKAEVNPTKVSLSLLADIVQSLMGVNRQTAMDYAKTLFSVHVFGDIRHSPKIIKK